MASIEMRGLTKTYPGGVTAVAGLDLTIADGEFFALLGPSGCGKTTLLRTVAGLEQATGGTLLLDEVAELTKSAQAKLLGVLENRCITRLGATSETPKKP